MSVTYKCDGCGKELPAAMTYTGNWKPSHWFERWDKDLKKNLHACSRECIKKAAKKEGGHTLVLPI